MTRLLVSLAMTMLFAACGGPSTDGPATAPDDTASAPASADPGGRKPRIESRRPEKGLVDVSARSFDRHKASGRTLTLFYTSGLDDCVGLDRIEVDESTDRVTVTIFEGRHPEAEVCAAVGVFVRSIVKLERPLANREVVDGSR